MDSSSSTIINVLIYVLDDNEIILNEVREAFTKAGVRNVKFFITHEKMDAEWLNEVQICIIDYWLGAALTGLEVMKKVLEKNDHCLPIIMTSQTNPDIIADLFNNGAFRYARKDKPGFLDELVEFVKQATKRINNQFSILQEIQQIHGYTKLLFQTCNTDGIIGTNNPGS